MKAQFNEYYQCSSSGYIKHENMPIDHLPVINEIPVASRCNEILPYKLHKLEVKEPLVISSAKEIARQLKEPTIQLPLKQPKKQNLLNYSFSASLMQDPSKLLQKDEVHSIHLDEKSNTRIKTIDLTKSTYSTARKHNPDMKRSLFSTNNSTLTHYTTSKQSEKLDMIAGQLKKEKEKREQFEKKYEILFNLVNRTQKPQTTVSTVEPSQKSQKLLENPQSKLRKNKSQKKKHYIRSDSESDEQSNDQMPIVVSSKKSQRKVSSPSPIIINLGSQLLQNSPNKRKQKNQNHSQHEQQDHLMDIKQGLNQIKQQVEVLHQNVGYLEKKIDEQQMRHQKQILMQQLKQKQRKIEQVIRENQKIKEINELLVNKKVESVNNESTMIGFKLEKNTIGVGFVISLLMILLVLNLRSAIC